MCRRSLFTTVRFCLPRPFELIKNIREIHPSNAINSSIEHLNADLDGSKKYISDETLLILFR